MKNLVTILFVVVVICSNVHCKGHHHGGKSHNKKKAVPRGKELLERSPRDTSETFSSLCAEACMKGGGSKVKRVGNYDPKSGSCLCEDKLGSSFKRTLEKAGKTKANTAGTRSTEQKVQPALIATQGNFSCNSTSRFSRGLCKIFCETFKKSEGHECSSDGQQCLCYSYKDFGKKSSVPRVKRQSVIESILTGDDEIIRMDPTQDNLLKRPRHFGGHGGHGGMYGHGHDAFDYHHPRPPPECSPYTCIDQCPRDCDSLCRFTGECYCSCPEDMSYEYYDEFSPFAAILG